jgi:hypothetical protein
MAKKITNKETGNGKGNDVSFIDRTDQKWYNKEGTNSVVFCDTIDDLINGKPETVGFVKKQISSRIVTRHEKEVEKSYYVLFTTSDGNAILVSRRNELK